MKKPYILDNHMPSLSRRRFIAGTGGLTFMISIGGLTNGNWASANEDSEGSKNKGSNITVSVSYTHLTLPTIYSV